jgi:hypothetical protein
MSKTNFSYSADRARKAKIKKFLLSKKFQYGVALLVISGILTGVTTVAFQAREESICKTESEKTFKEIFSEWEDTSNRAHSTGRIALAPVIGEMQAIKRKTEKIDVPKCAAFAKFLTIKAMNAKTKVFLDFMANREYAEYGSSNSQEEIAMEEIAAIQTNGKSNYNFNSENEMHTEYSLLLTKKLTERLSKTK